MTELSDKEKVFLGNISKELELSCKENTSVQINDTQSKKIEMMQLKLLHSLTETMKEIHHEVKQMRKSNERLEYLVRSAIIPVNMSYGSSRDGPKAVMVKKI